MALVAKKLGLSIILIIFNLKKPLDLNKFQFFNLIKVSIILFLFLLLLQAFF